MQRSLAVPYFLPFSIGHVEYFFLSSAESILSRLDIDSEKSTDFCCPQIVGKFSDLLRNHVTPFHDFLDFDFTVNSDPNLIRRFSDLYVKDCRTIHQYSLCAGDNGGYYLKK